MHKEIQLELFPLFPDLREEDQRDVSECFIYVGKQDGTDGRRIQDLNETSRKVSTIPEGKYTIFKTGGEHRLPEYKIFGKIFPFVKNNTTGKTITCSYSRGVYPCISLSGDEGSFQVYIHRLAAMAFVINQNPEYDYVADHLDEDKLNYKVDNIYWKTNGKNIKDVTKSARKLNKDCKVYRTDNYTQKETDEIQDA